MIGDLSLKGTGEVDVGYRRSISEPFAVGHFQAAFEGAIWRRSTGMIRQDSADFFYIRLVERGQLSATTSHGTCIANAGCFSFTQSHTPYFAELLPDPDGRHEGFYALVPGYLLGSRIPSLVNFGLPIPAREGAGFIARETLKMLFRQGELLDPLVRASLAETFLSAITQALQEVRENHSPHGSASKRFAEILRLIENHAANPELSATWVAGHCGISRRYLSALFRREGMSFSQFLQQHRLRIAKDMLRSPAMSEQSVGEISDMSGFNSVQYFCRIFKSKTGSTPMEYRRSRNTI